MSLLTKTAAIPALILFAAHAVAQDASRERHSVPAGTTLLVRMSETVDSSQHTTGDRFTVTLEADLVVDGVVVAPSGTTALGMLTHAKSGGRVVGKSELTVELTSLVIDDEVLPIVTESIAQEVKKSETRKSARNTGIGAGIGAIVGGGKGAAIGAAAALGGSAITRGKQVQIPAGTLLEFRLLAPVSV